METILIINEKKLEEIKQIFLAEIEEIITKKMKVIQKEQNELLISYWDGLKLQVNNENK